MSGQRRRLPRSTPRWVTTLLIEVEIDMRLDAIGNAGGDLTDDEFAAVLDWGPLGDLRYALALDTPLDDDGGDEVR